MTKYWKLMMGVVIIIGTIGTFYIQSFIASHQLPKITLQKKSGEDSEVDGLVIYGVYVEKGSQEHYFLMTKEDTTYLNEHSLFNAGDLESSELKQLQKKYRNFMRGKDERGEFFENDRFLAYVAMDESMSTWKLDGDIQWVMNIDVLHKKTRKRTSFTLHVPHQNKYEYVYIEEVWMNDETMHIVEKNDIIHRDSGLYETELHVYTIDGQTEKVVNDDVIVSVEDTFETNESIYVVNRDRFVTGDIDGMLFEKQRSKEVMSPNDDDAPTYEITDRQMFHYDLPSKELAELKYPKEIPVDAEMDWRNKDML